VSRAPEDLAERLFEQAGPLLERLRAVRHAEGGALMTKAREIIGSMSEAEQIAVINAHPRIGARPD
jgi:2-oxo-4-hydroxy-4-carboxy--5-ureidoimidazoline (OHCU) decarboxylase